MIKRFLCNKPYLCKICRTEDQAMFFGASKSLCKACNNKLKTENRLEAELNPPMIGDRKICVRCNTEKDSYYDFYRSNKTTCKSCLIGRSRAYVRANYKHFLWLQAKYRSEQNGREFAIEESDVVIPEICPVFGTPLSMDSQSSDDSPSIDRVDSAKGYTPDNIRVISLRANKLKNNATKDELKAILAYMERFS